MSILQLKQLIAAYLQCTVEDFVVNGVDLLLDAINDSHMDLQQQYDWEYAKVSVDALVSIANGCPISPLKLHGTDNYVTVKKINRAFIADGFGGVRPIRYVSRDYVMDDVQQRWDGVPLKWAPTVRDMPNYPTFYEVYLTQIGQTLMVYPTSRVIVPADPMPVYLDVFRLFPDYKDDDENSDFFLQYCDHYLKWDCICDLNTFRRQFVPRQEGNLAPPTDQRDAALKNCLAWNAGLVSTGDSAVSLI